MPEIEILVINRSYLLQMAHFVILDIIVRVFCPREAASAETYAVVLPKAGFPSQTQEPRRFTRDE